MVVEFEKRPCIVCGNLIPDRQSPPYPGHKKDCKLVVAFLKLIKESDNEKTKAKG